MDTDTFKKFVEDSKKTHGWKRIQWKTVAKEYLIILKHPADENTKAFQKSLQERYRKNKSEVVVTGTKSTEEQIDERQAAAAAAGTLIDLTQEKVEVVDSKGRPLKVGDAVRYVGEAADDYEENGEDMDGTITEIKEDGTVMGTWDETGAEKHEFEPDDIEKILSKEERVDEIRAVFSTMKSYSDVAAVFRRNNLMIEQDLSIRDVVTKELVFKLFHYSGPVTFPVSESHLFEEWDIEVDYPISSGYVKLGDKTFYYEFGGEYGDFTPDDALHYIDTKEQAEDWNMGNNWYPPDITKIKIDFGDYDVKVKEGKYTKRNIRLSEPHSGTEDVTLNIEVTEKPVLNIFKQGYYKWVFDKLFSAKTVKQYEEAIAAGANVIDANGTVDTNIFVIACQKQRTELIDHILNAHPGLLNSVDKEHDTGLAWAVYKGNHDIVKKLLKYPELDVNHKNRHGNTAFMEAFSANANSLSMKAARLLLTDKRTQGIVTRKRFIVFKRRFVGESGVNTQGPISFKTPIKVPVRCLACRRLFEATMLRTHLQSTNSCPLCRKPMDTLEFLTGFQIQRWNKMLAAEQDGESKLAAARKEMAAAQKTIDENVLKNRFRQFVVKEW
tara:strand:- start:13965 stop:15794 length:1830 start_codon:yes stop_codon:yes gene_type:complete